MIAVEINVLTGESIEREMTADEIAEIEAMQAKAEIDEADARP